MAHLLLAASVVRARSQGTAHRRCSSRYGFCAELGALSHPRRASARPRLHIGCQTASPLWRLVSGSLGNQEGLKRVRWVPQLTRGATSPESNEFGQVYRGAELFTGQMLGEWLLTDTSAGRRAGVSPAAESPPRAPPPCNGTQAFRFGEVKPMSFVAESSHLRAPPSALQLRRRLPMLPRSRGLLAVTAARSCPSLPHTTLVRARIRVIPSAPAGGSDGQARSGTATVGVVDGRRLEGLCAARPFPSHRRPPLLIWSKRSVQMPRRAKGWGRLDLEGRPWPVRARIWTPARSPKTERYS